MGTTSSRVIEAPPAPAVPKQGTRPDPNLVQIVPVEQKRAMRDAVEKIVGVSISLAGEKIVNKVPGALKYPGMMLTETTSRVAATVLMNPSLWMRIYKNNYMWRTAKMSLFSIAVAGSVYVLYNYFTKEPDSRFGLKMGTTRVTELDTHTVTDPTIIGIFISYLMGNPRVEPVSGKACHTTSIPAGFGVDALNLKPGTRASFNDNNFGVCVHVSVSVTKDKEERILTISMEFCIKDNVMSPILYMKNVLEEDEKIKKRNTKVRLILATLKAGEKIPGCITGELLPSGSLEERMDYYKLRVHPNLWELVKIVVSETNITEGEGLRPYHRALPNIFMLHGPPGTGKSAFPHLLAMITGRKCIIDVDTKSLTKTSDFESLISSSYYLGSTGSSSRVGTNETILLFDEVDEYFRKILNNVNEYNAFLSFIGSSKIPANVVIVMTSNISLTRLGVILGRDTKALTRPGRIREVFVGATPPTVLRTIIQSDIPTIDIDLSVFDIDIPVVYIVQMFSEARLRADVLTCKIPEEKQRVVWENFLEIYAETKLQISKGSEIACAEIEALKKAQYEEEKELARKMCRFPDGKE